MKRKKQEGRLDALARTGGAQIDLSRTEDGQGHRTEQNTQRRQSGTERMRVCEKHSEKNVDGEKCKQATGDRRLRDAETAFVWPLGFKREDEGKEKQTEGGQIQLQAKRKKSQTLFVAFTSALLWLRRLSTSFSFCCCTAVHRLSP